MSIFYEIEFAKYILPYPDLYDEDKRVIVMNLSKKIQDSIIDIAKKYHVRKVILFGSRARGDNWQRSDIDLAVTGGDVIRFALDVDEVIPTLLMFDVVNLDEPVQPELLESIRKEGIVLYEEI